MLLVRGINYFTLIPKIGYSEPDGRVFDTFVASARLTGEFGKELT